MLYEEIYHNIQPVKTSKIDKWTAYINLEKIGFINKTINHLENFVDAEDRKIYTLRMESR